MSTFEDRLDTVQGLPDGDEQLNAALELVRFADEEGDMQHMFDARSVLVSAAYGSGDHDIYLTTIPWLLEAHDKDPGLAPVEYVLWVYKWLLGTVYDVPEIGLDRIEELYGDFARRCRGARLSRRAELKERMDGALVTNQDTEAEKWFRAWQAEEGSDIDDCVACEAKAKARYLAHRGDTQAALETLRPILQGNVGCNSEPQGSYAAALSLLQDAGDLEAAARLHRRGYRMVRDDRSELGLVVAHVAFLAETGNVKRALALLERHRPWAEKDRFLSRKLDYLTAIGEVLVAAGRTGDDVAVRLPGTTSVRTDRVDLLADVVREAEAIAARYDQRNGNDGETRKVRERLQGAGTSVHYPLDLEVASPPQREAPADVPLFAASSISDSPELRTAALEGGALGWLYESLQRFPSEESFWLDVHAVLQAIGPDRTESKREPASAELGHVLADLDGSDPADIRASAPTEGLGWLLVLRSGLDQQTEAGRSQALGALEALEGSLGLWHVGQRIDFYERYNKKDLSSEEAKEAYALIQGALDTLDPSRPPGQAYHRLGWLRAQGPLLEDLGEDSIPSYEDLLQTSRVLEDSLAEGYALQKLMWLYMERQDPNRVLPLALQVWRHDTLDPDLRVSAGIAAGQTLAMLDRTDEAVDFLSALEKDLPLLGSAHEEKHYYQVLGSLTGSTGETEEAIRCYDEALSRSESAADHLAMLQSIVDVLHSAHDGRAVEKALEGLEVDASSPDEKSFQARLLTRAASFLTDHSYEEDALEMLDRAEIILDEAKDASDYMEGTSWNLQVRASILRDLGEEVEAYLAAERLMEVVRPLGDPLRTAQALDLLGSLQVTSGQAAEGLATLREARVTWDTEGIVSGPNKYWTVQALQALQALGDEEGAHAEMHD